MPLSYEKKFLSKTEEKRLKIMAINLILYLGGQRGNVLLIVTYDGSKRHIFSLENAS